ESGQFSLACRSRPLFSVLRARVLDKSAGRRKASEDNRARLLQTPSAHTGRRRSQTQLPAAGSSAVSRAPRNHHTRAFAHPERADRVSLAEWLSARVIRSHIPL